MRILMTTIGLGAILLAVPAVASDSPANSTSSGVADSNSNAKSAGAGTAKEKKYCIPYDEVTGSRVSAMECKTKSAWAREGVNVDEGSKQDR